MKLQIYIDKIQNNTLESWPPGGDSPDDEDNAGSGG